jgi:6-phosphogluconate dehydrogenase (decarboxylating)
MERVGFIGLGTMGGPMAANLRRRQFPMVVHAVRTDAMARLVELGAETASPDISPSVGASGSRIGESSSATKRYGDAGELPDADGV